MTLAIASTPAPLTQPSPRSGAGDAATSPGASTGLPPTEAAAGAVAPDAVTPATPTTRNEAASTAGRDAADRPLRPDDTAELSDREREKVRKLEDRDKDVRAHEQAHVAAAGPLYRGGPTYSYQRGPDGKRYAVGGSVQIDTSEGRTPEETIAKAQQIRRAALAPAEPSSTDRRIAAKASRMESEARRELSEERSREAKPASADVAEPSASPGATASADASTRAADEGASRPGVTVRSVSPARNEAPDATAASERETPSAAANDGAATLRVRPSEVLATPPSEALAEERRPINLYA